MSGNGESRKKPAPQEVGQFDGVIRPMRLDDIQLLN